MAAKRHIGLDLLCFAPVTLHSDPGHMSGAKAKRDLLSTPPRIGGPRVMAVGPERVIAVTVWLSPVVVQ